MSPQTITDTSKFLGKYAYGNAQGRIEVVNNNVNMTVVSKDDNNLKAEYEAGYVQGYLQENAYGKTHPLQQEPVFGEKVQ